MPKPSKSEVVEVEVIRDDPAVLMARIDALEAASKEHEAKLEKLTGIVYGTVDALKTMGNKGIGKIMLMLSGLGKAKKG